MMKIRAAGAYKKGPWDPCVVVSLDAPVFLKALSTKTGPAQPDPLAKYVSWSH